MYLQPVSNEIKYKLKVQMGLGYTYRINTDPYVCKKQQNFTVLEEKLDKENKTNLCQFSSGCCLVNYTSFKIRIPVQINAKIKLYL